MVRYSVTEHARNKSRALKSYATAANMAGWWGTKNENREEDKTFFSFRGSIRVHLLFDFPMRKVWERFLGKRFAVLSILLLLFQQNQVTDGQ